MGFPEQYQDYVGRIEKALPLLMPPQPPLGRRSGGRSGAL